MFCDFLDAHPFLCLRPFLFRLQRSSIQSDSLGQKLVDKLIFLNNVINFYSYLFLILYFYFLGSRQSLGTLSLSSVSRTRSSMLGNRHSLGSAFYRRLSGMDERSQTFVCSSTEQSHLQSAKTS